MENIKKYKCWYCGKEFLPLSHHAMINGLRTCHDCIDLTIQMYKKGELKDANINMRPLQERNVSK